MERLVPCAKRRRSEGLAIGEPPPRATEAREAANLGPTTHGKEPPPPPPPDAAAAAAAAGGNGGGGDGEDDVDRISGLPDGVLGEIVSLLPTKEACRTQILSPRWRHVWLASPLVVDATDLSTMPYFHRRDDKKFNAENAALASAVSRILSAHPGPTRRFCVPPHFLQHRPAAVDAWLSSPALANLRELDFWEQHDLKQYVQYMQPSPLALPPASAFGFSATLRVATFGKCELLDSSVQGIHFPHLKQLGLEDVSISEGSLHTIISSCPVLEYLLLKDIFGFGCLRISSNSLRSIGIGADGRRDNLQFIQEVVIVNARCLERFLYLGDPMSLTVISAPKLETFGSLNDSWFHYHRHNISLQGLKVVSLTTALTSVKTLALTSDVVDLYTVIELMKCFPCLEKLYIKSYVSAKLNLWRRKYRDFTKTFEIHLKTIVMKQYRGSRSQINFASFFLLNARELDSMTLEVGTSNCNEAFLAEQYKILKMEKRVSRGAQLHLTKNSSSIYVDHVRDLSVADPFELV